MIMYRYVVLSVMVVTLFTGVLFPVLANETYLISPVVPYATVRFNNENWHTLPHPPVAEFSIRPDGSAYGRLVNGIDFVQYNVPNTYGIRVQRFEIQDHYHYVVEGTIAYSISELSILLATAAQNTKPVS